MVGVGEKRDEASLSYLGLRPQQARATGRCADLRLQRQTRRAKGRGYPCYKASLTKAEGERLLQVSNVWEITDVDPKGYVEFKAPSAEVEAVASRPIHTSFNFWGSRAEWEAFKDLCRRHGTDVCHVLSDLVLSCLAKDDHVLEAGSVQIVNVWAQRPRGHGQDLVTCQDRVV